MEAVEMGCEFDPLLVAWLHKDCPRDGTEEFLQYRDPSNPWKYWYDANGTYEIPDMNALARIGNGNLYYTTAREHLVHCAYLLVREHRVLARGGRLDGLTGSKKHGVHCAEYLLSYIGIPEEQLDSIESIGDVGFLSC